MHEIRRCNVTWYSSCGKCGKQLLMYSKHGANGTFAFIWRRAVNVSCQYQLPYTSSLVSTLLRETLAVNLQNN